MGPRHISDTKIYALFHFQNLKRWLTSFLECKKCMFEYRLITVLIVGWLCSLSSNAEDVDKIYHQTISRQLKYQDWIPTLQSGLSLLTLSLGTLDTWKGLQTISVIRIRQRSNITNLFDKCLLLSLNIKNFRLYCIVCDELVDVDRFSLANTVDSVDCLTFNAFLPPPARNPWMVQLIIPTMDLRVHSVPPSDLNARWQKKELTDKRCWQLWHAHKQCVIIWSRIQVPVRFNPSAPLIRCQ